MVTKESVMKENIWAKTLLGVYRHLETVSDAIDKIVLKTALNSYHFSLDGDDVLSTSNKLIELGERKVTLINLKLLVEDILTKIGQNEADILICRYIEGMKFKDIAFEKGLGLRTVFRRLDKAETSFTKKLLNMGYNSLSLQNKLKSEKWILNYYYDIQSSKTDEVEIKKIAL